MSTKYKRYSAQFKEEAVQLVVQNNQTISHVAKELGVHETTLGDWVTRWRSDNPPPRTIRKGRIEETSWDRSALEKENRRLRTENEFLKKQRPSSQRRILESEVRVDGRGEGQLSHSSHGQSFEDKPFRVLRLAES